MTFKDLRKIIKKMPREAQDQEVAIYHEPPLDEVFLISDIIEDEGQFCLLVSDDVPPEKEEPAE